MRSRLAVFVLVAALAAAPATAAHIIPYWDPAASVCNINIGAFQPGTLYVFALLSSYPALCGISGAQVRVTGFPAPWFRSCTPVPGSTIEGDLFQEGAHVRFDACRFPPWVLLFACNFFTTTQEAPILIQVTRPGGAPPDRPQLVLCDAPVYTVIEAWGGTAGINCSWCCGLAEPVVASDDPCPPVAVQRRPGAG